jgi:hypothetical protein
MPTAHRSVALRCALLLALAVGCPAGAGDDGIDDDDTPPADDDDDLDDDDTGDADDDDFSYATMSFDARLTVSPLQQSGSRDDDDSAADDDDSAGPVFIGQDVSIIYTFTHWKDQASGVLRCRQHIQAEGELVLGQDSAAYAGCARCTGVILVDPASAVDLSDPAVDPEHCDTAALEAAGTNYGVWMTHESVDEETGGGDFLSMGLMEPGVMQTLGLTADVGGMQSVAQIESDLGGEGLVLVQVGLIDAHPDTISYRSGLDAVANPEAPASSWFFFWHVCRDPAINPYEGAGMQGDYQAGSFWQFGGSG